MTKSTIGHSVLYYNGFITKIMARQGMTLPLIVQTEQDFHRLTDQFLLNCAFHHLSIESYHAGGDYYG